ncbi:hypothetical protein [Kitasatospora sp. NPDC057223]|uniref:hypothetical protein n=1 Tax=Kitasatospora sp. NPDC057223 TaxID=3346055 RepID=UPI00363C0BFC
MTPHTSPQPPAGPHPGIDDLADLAEGLTESPAAAGALRAHLDGCPECRDTLAALTEVQELLGAVETPPMPADVALRLDAALAAEAAAPRTAAGPGHPAPLRPGPARTAPTAPPGGPGGGPGRPRPAGRLRRRTALLGGAVALAAAVLGAVLLSPVGPGQHSDSAAGSASVATTREPAATAPGAAIGPGTAGTPALPGTAGGAEAPGAQHPAAAAGTAYRADTLPAQIRQLLGAGEDTAPPAGDKGATTPAAAGPCAPAVPSPLLATDHGTFEGRPVDVLVYATPGDPDLLDVYLVDPGCPAGPDPVRLHRAVPLR